MNFLFLLALALPSSAASPHAKSLPDLIAYVIKHGKDEKLRPSVDKEIGITEPLPIKSLDVTRKDAVYQYDLGIDVVYKSTEDALHPILLILNDGRFPIDKNHGRDEMWCFKSDLSGGLLAAALATDDRKHPEEHQIPLNQENRQIFENLKKKLLKTPFKAFTAE
jgi:hypothetical protein